jgi:predicted Zn-dependent protease
VENSFSVILNTLKMKQIIYAALLMFITACSTVPLTNRRQFTAIPSSQMLSLSNESYKTVLETEKISKNNQATQNIRVVGNRITKAVEEYLRSIDRLTLIDGYKWEYNLLESKTMNAWCMPGGKIVFYEGILPVCKNDNGIAVVMAHEIAHAIANHGNERMSQQMVVEMGGVALSEALRYKKEETTQLALLAFGVGTQVGVILPYSRKHESEADEMGLYFMAMAGYDPREAPLLWERMQQSGSGGTPEFLSTHPNPQSRINELNKIMPKAIEYYNQHNK